MPMPCGASPTIGLDTHANEPTVNGRVFMRTVSFLAKLNEARLCWYLGWLRIVTAIAQAPMGPRSVAVRSSGCLAEYGERGVEAVLAAPAGLVVGFGGNESDQLVEFVIGG